MVDPNHKRIIKGGLCPTESFGKRSSHAKKYQVPITALK